MGLQPADLADEEDYFTTRVNEIHRTQQRAGVGPDSDDEEAELLYAQWLLEWRNDPLQPGVEYQKWLLRRRATRAGGKRAAPAATRPPKRSTKNLKPEDEAWVRSMICPHSLRPLEYDGTGPLPHWRWVALTINRNRCSTCSTCF